MWRFKSSLAHHVFPLQCTIHILEKEDGSLKAGEARIKAEIEFQKEVMEIFERKLELGNELTSEDKDVLEETKGAIPELEQELEEVRQKIRER